MYAIIIIVCSYILWERVTGGQVQGSLCSTTTNPILLFNTDVTTELVTVPLNLTDVRYAPIIYAKCIYRPTIVRKFVQISNCNVVMQQK